ncbi:MAG TPA: potassium channel family protein [Dissulfurispiraceae bacterium]|nr:potassium channel family protein [Dissulfurispiraceae bacterium]
MRLVAVLPGVFLIFMVLWESFETIILPRRVTRPFRLTRLFYRNSWRAFQSLVRLFPLKQRETLLSYFGPLSLLLLLSIWAAVIIIGFSLIYWADGSPARMDNGPAGLFASLYLSGTNFFTLGLGDVAPRSSLAKLITVLESGMGLGFLALIIGYLPALNQSFQRREINISLLDARAGSPPSAVEILKRHKDEIGLQALKLLLHEWEIWSAEFLESHLSYPVLAYFRSQHDNQSWLAALTAILDVSSLVMAGVKGACTRQAELTFAMARHAIVDLSIVFRRRPQSPNHSRLPSEVFVSLKKSLEEAGYNANNHDDFEKKLMELRGLYEPYAHALSEYFRMPLPPWMPKSNRPDNWQISTWESGSAVRRTIRNIEESRHF